MRIERCRSDVLPRSADAIVIGAGVIGAAVTYELGKRGMRALSIDRNAAAGYGSTSSSSACVRAHYSSRESVALAYEGFSYWQDWGNYLGTEDERGHAPYVNCGTVLLTSDDGQYRTSLEFYDALGLPYEDWDREPSRSGSPPGVDLAADGFHTADGDQGIYFRPETGGMMLVGSEDPECDPREWVQDPDHFDRAVTREHWEAHVYRLALRSGTGPRRGPGPGDAPAHRAHA